MERWLILAVLTLARTSMGLQFQAVPALGAGVAEAYGLSYAALGLLIGLYLLPGVALAVPGGWLGQRFGDKRLVLAGLLLMSVGGILLALAPGAPGLFAGRLLSGAGAVLLNVLVTKMVADWFAGRDTLVAMGILITSWPVGIGLAMVTLPPLAEAAGLKAALLVGTALAVLSLGLVALVYRAPPRAGSAVPDGSRLSRRGLALALLAGAVWAFYNVGLILVLSFGPDLVVSLGADPVAAAAVVSLVGWLIIPSLVAGGWIAARVGRPDLLLVGCLVLAVAVALSLPAIGGAVWPFLVLGLVIGPPGPLIMTLPVAAVRPQNRALGMGIYFTCYYAAMAAIPPLAGALRDSTGNPAAPIWVAVACLGIAIIALAAFRQVQKRAADT